MSQRVCLSDGRWFDAEKATAYDEETWWDGSNLISCATGSQWNHERLYKTAGGVWILHAWSQYQGVAESHRVLHEQEAIDWLLANGHEDVVPEKELAAREI